MKKNIALSLLTIFLFAMSAQAGVFIPVNFATTVGATGPAGAKGDTGDAGVFGGTVTSNIDMDSQYLITNLANPINDSDAVNRWYVDTWAIRYFTIPIRSADEGNSTGTDVGSWGTDKLSLSEAINITSIADSIQIISGEVSYGVRLKSDSTARTASLRVKITINGTSYYSDTHSTSSTSATQFYGHIHIPLADLQNSVVTYALQGQISAAGTYTVYSGNVYMRIKFRILGGV